MRERDRTISDAADAHEKARLELQANPRAALSLIQEALRLCHAVGLRCLESRCLALLGIALGRRGRVQHAEVAFGLAYGSGCPCCRPYVDRHFAYLLWDQPGRAADALFYAERGVQDAAPADKGRAYMALGVMQYYAGNGSAALTTIMNAVNEIPVSSIDHPQAMANLATALAASEDAEEIRQAAAMLEGLEERFKGVRRVTLQRAQLAWTTGQTLGRLVRVAGLKSWERRRNLQRAQDLLVSAVEAFEHLKLDLYVAAARADLALIHAMLDPLKVVEALAPVPGRGRQDGRSFDLGGTRRAAVEAADGLLSPDRIQKIWTALQALREATVRAGAAPPVLPYTS